MASIFGTSLSIKEQELLNDITIDPDNQQIDFLRDLDLQQNKILNLADCQNDGDAVNKKILDLRINQAIAGSSGALINYYTKDEVNQIVNPIETATTNNAENITKLDNDLTADINLKYDKTGGPISGDVTIDGTTQTNYLKIYDTNNNNTAILDFQADNTLDNGLWILTNQTGETNFNGVHISSDNNEFHIYQNSTLANYNIQSLTSATNLMHNFQINGISKLMISPTQLNLQNTRLVGMLDPMADTDGVNVRFMNNSITNAINNLPNIQIDNLYSVSDEVYVNSSLTNYTQQNIGVGTQNPAAALHIFGYRPKNPSVGALIGSNPPSTNTNINDGYGLVFCNQSSDRCLSTIDFTYLGNPAYSGRIAYDFGVNNNSAYPQALRFYISDNEGGGPYQSLTLTNNYTSLNNIPITDAKTSQSITDGQHITNKDYVDSAITTAINNIPPAPSSNPYENVLYTTGTNVGINKSSPISALQVTGPRSLTSQAGGVGVHLGHKSGRYGVSIISDTTTNTMLEFGSRDDVDGNGDTGTNILFNKATDSLDINVNNGLAMAIKGDSIEFNSTTILNNALCNDPTSSDQIANMGYVEGRVNYLYDLIYNLFTFTPGSDYVTLNGYYNNTLAYSTPALTNGFYILGFSFSYSCPNFTTADNYFVVRAKPADSSYNGGWVTATTTTSQRGVYYNVEFPEYFGIDPVFTNKTITIQLTIQSTVMQGSQFLIDWSIKTTKYALIPPS